MRSIGIDIGTLSIKIAEVEGSPRNFTLVDYLEVPFAPDLAQDHKVQIIETLRKISSHYDPQQVQFVMSVSQNHISVRFKEFPFKERTKIIKSLPFELEDEVPFEASNSVFDGMILKYKEKSTDLLAAICPNKYISEILVLAHDAGIDPDIITSDGFALTNLLTGSEPPTENTSLLNDGLVPNPADEEVDRTPASLHIHIGHSKSIFIFMKGSVVCEIRSLSFGGANIVSRIQKTYEISYPEALKGLQEKGFVLTKTEGASQDQIIFSKSISTGLDKFLFEVRKTILEVESQFDVGVNQIHIFGGVSFLVNLAPYMTQKLGINCNIFNPLSLGFKIEASDTLELKKNSSVAIGVAVEGLKRGKYPAINFRKGDLAKEGKSFKFFYEKWKVTLKYAAVAFCLLFVFSIIKDNLATSMSERASEILKKQGNAPEVGLKRENEIRKFVKSKMKELAENKRLAQLQYINTPIDIISQISNSFPSKKQVSVDIRHLKVDNESVVIEGEVSQKSQIEEIKKSLRNIVLNNKIQDLPSKPSPVGKLGFGLSFEVARKTPGAPE